MTCVTAFGIAIQMHRGPIRCRQCSFAVVLVQVEGIGVLVQKVLHEIMVSNISCCFAVILHRHNIASVGKLAAHPQQIG